MRLQIEPMILLIMQAGLGNQLFQYAAASTLARRLQRKLILSTEWFDRPPPEESDRKFLLRNFMVDDPEIRDLKTARWWTSRVCRPARGVLRRASPWFGTYTWADRLGGFQELPEETIKEGMIAMRGCWETERYFHSDRDAIRLAFKWRSVPEHSSELEHLVRSANMVCVHVRRGDRIAVEKWRNSFVCLSAEYYLPAMQFMADRVPNPHFLVFSDDPGAARRMLPGRKDVTFAADYGLGTDLSDFYLMRQCRHFIIANSTFSWWAAWLGDDSGKIVVAPSRWMSNGHPVDDMVPADWHRV